MGAREAAGLLGVARSADRATIEMAFRRAARVAHPDAGGTQAAFAQLLEARQVLLSEPPPPTVVVVSRWSMTRRRWRLVRARILRRLGRSAPPRVR